MNHPVPPTDALAAESPAATPAFSPLYQQIKGLILQSLQASEWKPGESIPSEMELAARYRVSQGTVRKAIDELASGHLLIRKQGKGTFVATHAEHQVQYRFLKLVPDQGDLNTEGPAQREIVDCKRLRASAEIARENDIAPNQICEWKRQLEERLCEVFQSKGERSKELQSEETKEAQLERKIGQLVIEKDFLLKKCKQLGIDPSEKP